MFSFLNVSIQNLQIIHFYVFMCGQKQRMHKFVCVYKLNWTRPRVLAIILLWLEVNNINLLNKLSWICSICCYTIVNCSPESISLANSVLPQAQSAIFRARGIKFTIWWISDTMYRTKVSFVWFWKKKSAIINNIIIGRGWAVLVTKENKIFNKWIVKKYDQNGWQTISEQRIVYSYFVSWLPYLVPFHLHNQTYKAWNHLLLLQNKTYWGGVRLKILL